MLLAGRFRHHASHIWKKTGAAVVLVHHTDKKGGRGARGHSTLPPLVGCSGLLNRASDLAVRSMLTEVRNQFRRGFHIGVRNE
jgi:hypothetical protein